MLQLTAETAKLFRTGVVMTKASVAMVANPDMPEMMVATVYQGYEPDPDRYGAAASMGGMTVKVGDLGGRFTEQTAEAQKVLFEEFDGCIFPFLEEWSQQKETIPTTPNSFMPQGPQ